MRDLFFLSAADFVVRSSLVQPGPLFAKTRETLSCTVAVCVRDDGSLVLVDAGFSEAACRDPIQELGCFTRRCLGLRLSPEHAIVHQLEALGFDRGQVAAVVATHCHLDHIGGLCDFPNAELIATSEELKAIGDIAPRLGYRPTDLAQAQQLRIAQLTGPRHLGFPASLDLFGDGEITLLDAEGHSSGHLAVLLVGPSGAYLHAGDALLLEWEAGQGFEGPGRVSRLICTDARALDRTLEALRQLGIDESAGSAPRIVPAHDRRVFDTLPHAPLDSGAVSDPRSTSRSA
ncbi:MAG: MBL fold metallo-hydrolase [Myxococcales bacterium]|nr:MBL fold metallo-hydrolase [Myxococcales bacterium]